jgi:hypothetical protein
MSTFEILQARTTGSQDDKAFHHECPIKRAHDDNVFSREYPYYVHSEGHPFPLRIPSWLLVAQSDQGIDVHRAAGRDITRQQRNHRHKERYANVGDRIEWTDPVKFAGQQPRDYKGS